MTVTPRIGNILLTLILILIPWVLSEASCPACVRKGCCDRLNHITETKLEVGETLNLTARGSTFRGCHWSKLAEDGSEHCCFSDPNNYNNHCGENYTNPEGCRKMEEVTLDMGVIGDDRCNLIIEDVYYMDNGTYECSIDTDWKEISGEKLSKFPVIVMNIKNDITETKLEAGETLRLNARGSTRRGCSWWKLAEDGSQHCCFSDPDNYNYFCGENHTNPEGCRQMKEVTIDIGEIEDKRCILIIEHVTNMDNGTYQCSIAIENDGQNKSKFPVFVTYNWYYTNLTIGICVTIIVIVIVIVIVVGLLYRNKKYQEKNNKREDLRVTTAVSENQYEDIEKIIKEGRIPLSLARDESGNSVLHQIALPGVREDIRDLILEYFKTNIEKPNTSHPHARYENNDDPESTQQLIVSCENNVKSLLKATNKRGETPLHLSCKYQWFSSKYQWKDVYNFLIDQEVDLNAQTLKGDTALHYATTEGNEEVVKYLLDKGAEVDTPNNDGLTPIFKALESDGIDMVKGFLQKGDDVLKKKDETNMTPLHHVIKYNNTTKLIPMVELLLEKGAAIDEINSNGHTPVHIAVMKKKPQIVKVLLKKEKEKFTAIVNDTKTNKGETILEMALGTGVRFTVLLILKSITNFKQQKLKIHKSYDMKWTILHYAAYSGNVDLVNFILQDLKAESCKDVQTEEGFTPLYLAIDGRSTCAKDVVEILLKDGGNPNVPDYKEKKTALHIAAESGMNSIVKLLLDYKVHITMRTKEGLLPIHSAIIEKDEDKLRRRTNLAMILCQHYVDEGKVDLLIEKTRKDGDIVVESLFAMAVRQGMFTIVKFLLEKSQQDDNLLQDYDRDGCPLLYSAAKGGHSDIWCLLITKADAFEIVDNDDVDGGFKQSTLLHLAVRAKNKKAVEIVLGKTGNLEKKNLPDTSGLTMEKDQAGNTPLDVAEELRNSEKKGSKERKELDEIMKTLKSEKTHTGNEMISVDGTASGY